LAVNEKTLELNITHEILTIAQRSDSHAFAFGTTMRREGNLGFDSRILGSLPGQWRSAVLQYKRPYGTQNQGQSYLFEINNNKHKDQHALLQQFCGGMHGVAFYVLPIYLDLVDVRRDTPHLIDSVYLADVMDISMHIVDGLPHDIEVFPSQSMGVLHSMEARFKLERVESILSLIHSRKAGLDLETIRKNMKSEPSERVKTMRPRINLVSFPSSQIGVVA
jgi:hypothetical protein